MNIKVKPAVLDDIDKIYDTELVSFTDPWTREGLANALKEHFGIFLAAFDGDDFAGYIIGSYDGYSGYIEKTAVSPDHRRQGIGIMLLDSFEKALDNNADNISLEVRCSNEAAILLYEKAGFMRAGVRKNFYSFPKEDAFVMIKDI